jgi:hypothetical protein
VPSKEAAPTREINPVAASVQQNTERKPDMKLSEKGALIAVAMLTTLWTTGCKPKPPVTFVPPAPATDASEMPAALGQADGDFKDYTLSQTPAQIQLHDISLVVVNQMDTFAEPETNSSPGFFGFGGKPRALRQDEREKVTASVKKSTVAYLNERFRVTDSARFKVIVILSGRPGVHIENGYDPYGIEDFSTILVDTQSKSVIWSSSMEAYGKTLDDATDVAAKGVPEQLDVLFGIKKE